MPERPSLDERKQAVKSRVGLAGMVERHVKLSGSAGSRNRRGRCPFHQGSSASFSVQAEKGFAHCFGCQWHGDAIDFARDIMGLSSWMAALEWLEAEAGLSAQARGCNSYAPAPIARERNPAAPPKARRRELVEPIEMARAIWRFAAPDARAVRRYFSGRGVPEAALTERRMNAFRYLAECPCVAWDRDRSAAGMLPNKSLVAPAIMALMRVPTMMRGDSGNWLEWVPTGLHVTYLSPDGEGTMIRRKPWAKPGDPDPMLPKRRMLGPASGACVLLEEYRPGLHLWIGEGNETVLSAMGLAGVDAGTCGIAVLSLDNLQGQPLRWRNGALPLHDVQPDPERRGFLVPGHRGAVTGLVDSDMSPLGNQLVALRKGAIPVRRAIAGAERARICGELFVKSWRAAGADPVDALRAPAGMDFNDAARAAREAVDA